MEEEEFGKKNTNAGDDDVVAPAEDGGDVDTTTTATTPVRHHQRQTQTRKHVRPTKKRVAVAARSPPPSPAGEPAARASAALPEPQRRQPAAAVRSILKKHAKYAGAAASVAPTKGSTGDEKGRLQQQQRIVTAPARDVAEDAALLTATTTSVVAAGIMTEGIVERRRRRQRARAGANSSEQEVSSSLPAVAASATAVEGYETGTGIVGREGREVAPARPSGHEDDDDLVFRSLADLMEKAGTLSDGNTENDGTAAAAVAATTTTTGEIEPGSVVEAHLSFKCIDPDTYRDELRRTQYEGGEEDIEEEVEGEDAAGHEPARDTLAAGNELGIDDNKENEEYDDNSLFDSLHGGDGDNEYDDDEENVGYANPADDDDNYGDDGGRGNESGSGNSPRLFMVLWKALSQWVTPKAVQYVRGGDPIIFSNGDVDDNYEDNDYYWQRCAGLMAQLQIHLSDCFGQVCDARRRNYCSGSGKVGMDLLQAQRRLSELLRSFDYALPNPKLKSGQVKALCCVLLDIVLDFDVDDSITVKDIFVDSKEVLLPKCCREDMTVEEYRYLTRSAFINFGIPDDAVV